ncbi:Pup--protein ligase [Bifidobacterium aemilianum]|uniref:Pup--protein ligase n=1 Tax=Bifidobacterium aemilianum TaxID=2493120 RepID=A0A366KB01_9BIFI|nr:proteasome accessory factor PafA2 family protein [Bifidobacterium aemilianum]RBP98422.1 Pup--protein ligase [Bifidobacterium aemilianum]
MPQLRDSGNHGSQAGLGPSSGLAGFSRIFGIETEYGVSLTGSEQPVEAGEVAMAMFTPVLARSRSTNTYLPNGARLYLDVGSHPEYATAEAADPLDALAQDLAGEAIMRRLALEAQGGLQERYGDQARIHVYKNNVDSAGHSFGCHENYLVRRFVPLPTIEAQLLPFLISRQILTGAGRMTGQGLVVTQRAKFLDEAISSATTRSRPMVNTRDEPHADPDEFRRLHVIIGDSNRSQFAAFMKTATTHLVLCVIEEAARLGVPSGLEACALADPMAANRALSGDLTCTTARFRLADGRGQTSAVELQERYLAVAGDFVSTHEEAMAASLPSSDCQTILKEWSKSLEAIRSGHMSDLTNRLDWLAKDRLMAGIKSRHPAISPTKLKALDLDYHDLANGSIYHSMVRHGVMVTLLDRDTVDQCVDHPPANTRAALRGAFVNKAQELAASFSCDWTHLQVSSPRKREVLLLDPFDSRPNPDYLKLMQALGEEGPAAHQAL